MAFRINWSPSARFDLKDIAAFIAKDKPLAAKQAVNRLLNAVERLSDFPESGRMVPEFSEPEIREMILRPFRIVYRVKKEQHLVIIVRVWHSARGIPDIG